LDDSLTVDDGKPYAAKSVASMLRSQCITSLHRTLGPQLTIPTYVARLPTPCKDVTEWTKTLDDSPTLALPNDADSKPLISNDDKDDVTS
jgi:hypothetical protein